VPLASNLIFGHCPRIYNLFKRPSPGRGVVFQYPLPAADYTKLHDELPRRVKDYLPEGFVGNVRTDLPSIVLGTGPLTDGNSASVSVLDHKSADPRLQVTIHATLSKSEAMRHYGPMLGSIYMSTHPTMEALIDVKGMDTPVK